MARDDPWKPGKVIPGDHISYDWFEVHTEPNFDEEGCVYSLNQWRAQIFRRLQGPSRKPRVPWVMSEKRIVLQLLKIQLETREIVKLNCLANNFKTRRGSVTQKVGEILLTQGTSNHATLLVDRERL